MERAMTTVSIMSKKNPPIVLKIFPIIAYLTLKARLWRAAQEDYGSIYSQVQVGDYLLK